MLKIILIIIIFAIVGFGIYFWFKTPKTVLENPTIQGFGKILGFSKNTSNENNTNKDKQEDLFTQTENSLVKNTQKSIETARDVVYNNAKTTLDNVFDKQQSDNQEVSVNVLGVANNNANQPSYVIDLAKDSNLKMNLSLNTKYYLKFQNIPQNYCLYINNNKYPLTGGIVEVQFEKGGSFPIRTNSCDLNDKSIGTLTVQ